MNTKVLGTLTVIVMAICLGFNADASVTEIWAQYKAEAGVYDKSQSWQSESSDSPACDHNHSYQAGQHSPDLGPADPPYLCGHCSADNYSSVHHICVIVWYYCSGTSPWGKSHNHSWYSESILASGYTGPCSVNTGLGGNKNCWN